MSKLELENLKALPRLGFITTGMGNYSEVWMWRQLTGITRLNVSLLTPEYKNKDIYPPSGVQCKEFNFMSHFANRTRYSKWFYRLRCISGWNFYAPVGEERKKIERWMFQVKPDVILAQFGTTGLGILPVAKEFDIPVVVHFHGFDLSSALNNRWYRWSLLSNLNDFSVVVVVGNHQKDWMLEHGVNENSIHLIPCGVPTDEYIYRETKKGRKKIRFIVVSRLVEKKGIEFTIKAFAIVKQNYSEVEFRIFGDGPLEGVLQDLVKDLGLEESVKFKGSIPPDRVKEEMIFADVFLQHSIEASTGDLEGSPVSTAEASSCGLPLVCSNAKGIIDQVIDGKTGFLVKEKDYKAMAEKMLILARDPELRSKMGQEGRKHMINFFDTKKQIAKLEDVLLNCVKL